RKPQLPGKIGAQKIREIGAIGGRYKCIIRRTKGKRIKKKVLIEVLGETKPKSGVPVVRLVPIAVRRTNEPRFVVPGTATDHALGAIAAAPLLPVFTAILRRTRVVFMPAVLHPFIYVASRVMQP